MQDNIARITAATKMLGVLVAFEQKLIQAITAKQPLSVLLANWAVTVPVDDKFSAATFVDKELPEIFAASEVVVHRLSHVMCQVLVDLTCCGMYTIQQNSNETV